MFIMKKLFSLLMVMAMLLSVIDAQVNVRPTPDSRLVYLAENCIMVVYEFGKFKLEANISRAEVAKVIYVAYGIEGAAGEIFSDMEDSHWEKGLYCFNENFSDSIL